jgi:hypothetical protein
MTQFEYVGIGVSLVVGLAVARLLEGARDSFDPHRRFWIHSLWVVNKLMNATLLFWAGWVYRDTASWSFIDFVVLLASPGIVFLQAHALVTANPHTITDWRAHFWSIRRFFFAANVVQILLNFVTVYLISGVSFPSPEAVPLTVVLLLSVVGALTESERAHAVIAVVAFMNLTLGFGSLFLQAA